MKILHISTIIEWRGGDKQMLTTYEILKDFPDLEQYVLAPEGSVLAEKCKEGGIPYFTASRRSKFSFPFLNKIIEIIKKEGIDLVHVHDSNALSLSLVALRFSPKVKLVYSRKRNNRVKNNYFKRAKYNNPLITRMICVSQAVKDVLIPVLKDPEKAEVIYDGIDVEQFSQVQRTGAFRKDLKIGPDTVLIGNIAGLTKQKDLFTFIDAAELILKETSQKIKFIIIGEGPLKSELQDHAITKGISEHIIFAGFRKDIHNILPDLDIFLISSETEGLPLSVLEAFACKVPVVATAAGGTGEAVKHRITGMISPVKDPEKLAANVKALLGNKGLQEEITVNAQQLVLDKFSLDVMQRNYYDFYKKLKGK